MYTRLISPMIAVIGRLDTTTMAAPVAGFDSGYDRVFREPRRLPAAGQVGTSTRTEIEVRVRCQVETEHQNRLQAAQAGDSPTSEFTLVMRSRELEDEGLLDANGDPILKKQDRLIRIETRDGDVEQTFPDPPGLYVHEVRKDSHGMSLIAPRAQLVIVTFRARELSVR